MEREGLATSWLFGTIHVPDDRINALHPAVKAALEGADAFYGELALDSTEELGKQVLAAGTFEEGHDLREIVSDELWERLDQRLQKHGMSAAMLRRFKPFLVNLTLVQLDMLPLIQSGKKALDERIFLVAKAKGKEVGGVEQVEEQIQALAYTLTLEESVASISQGLDDMDKADARGVSDLERIMRAWLTGSGRLLLAIGMESWDLNDPVDQRSRKALLLDRNVHMAERTARKLTQAPEKSFVFAFGAFHFLGEGSVVELLQKDGFTVTRMCAPDPEAEQRLLDEDPWLKPKPKTVPVGAGG